MTDPVMLSIANALAVKTVSMAADGSKNAITALIRIVRDRFTRSNAATEALDAAQAAPENRAAVQQLAQELERAAAADGNFDSQLRALWAGVRADLVFQGGRTVNSNTGTVGGHLIQTRDLHVEGDLRLGDVQNPG
jgi:hypothetical protein